nr:MAG TPA: hypothetical protein [Caudoviricetes sp.]
MFYPLIDSPHFHLNKLKCTLLIYSHKFFFCAILSIVVEVSPVRGLPADCLISVAFL